MKITRRRVAIVAAIGVAVAAGVFVLLRGSGGQDQVPPPQQVAVAKGNLSLSVTASGSLKPIAAKSADLSFRSSGVVEEVYVQVGDQVKKDQALARLELRPLQNAASQSDIAFRSAQLSLQALQQAARPEDVTTAQASLESARQRYALMQQQGLPDDVAVAEANAKSAQAKFDQLTNPTASDLLAAQAAVESAKASLTSAQQKLNLLQNPSAADVAAAESSLEAAHQKLDALRNPTATDRAAAQAAVASATVNATNTQIALDNLLNPLPETVAAAQAAVYSAEASVNSARNSLINLQSTLTTDKRRQLIDAYIALSQAREALQAKQSVKAPDAEIAAAQQEVLRLLRLIDQLEADVTVPNPGSTAQEIRAAQSSIANAESNLAVQQVKLQKLLAPLSSDILAAQNSAAAAKASLESAQAKYQQLLTPTPNDLAAAQAGFDAASAKYQQLLNPTSDDVAAAQSSVAVAQANLQTAQARLAQIQNPSSVDLAGAQSALQQAQTNLEKARTPYKDADLAAQQSSLAQAEASLSKTMQPGAPLDIAKSQLAVDRAKVDLESAQFNLDQATLVSPIDGIVSKVSINPGASQGVGASTVVMSVIDLSVMQVDVNIDETDISKVELKQPAVLTVDAVGQRPYRGTVVAIAPSATVQSGVTSYVVTVSVSDPRGLKAGMTATVNIVYQSKTDVLLIPNRAIRTVSRERQVQVLVDGKAETRTVQTGLADDQRTEITDGLNEGDIVLVETARTATRTAQAPGGFVPGGGGIPGVGGLGGVVRPAGR